MEYIRVELIDMPPTVRGLTTYAYGDDGQVYYTMFINAGLSSAMQCAAYDHEIRHIDNHDFDCMIPVEDLEAARHNGYDIRDAI